MCKVAKAIHTIKKKNLQQLALTTKLLSFYFEITWGMQIQKKASELQLEEKEKKLGK